ncbi:MAG: SHOCT domain-containing protein [Chloroflexi bacterium]|nr:SHOCT domain-containing protein [Chloroflexota bacterium]
MNKSTWAIVIVVVLVLLAIVAGVFAISALVPGSRLNGWGMMRPWMMGGFGSPFVGGLVMLLFGVLIIGGIVWLIQAAAHGFGQPGSGAPPSELPLDILKRRYAKGEITKEQFEQMKRDLGL